MKSYGRRVSSLDAVGLATGMLAGFQPGSAWFQEVDLALNEDVEQNMFNPMKYTWLS